MWHEACGNGATMQGKKRQREGVGALHWTRATEKGRGKVSFQSHAQRRAQCATIFCKLRFFFRLFTLFIPVHFVELEGIMTLRQLCMYVRGRRRRQQGYKVYVYVRIRDQH